MCIELDTSFWAAGGRLKVGAKRSPVRTPEQARALAREIVGRPGFELAGLMGYEAHIAGLGDRPLGKRLEAPVIRAIKRRSAAEIAERRAAVVAAVREVAPLPLVNGGGTGSIHTTVREEAVTEVTAGSGFYAPTLFDRYDDFSLQPGGDVRPARGAPAQPRRGHAAGRRLPGVGGRCRPTDCPSRTCRPACGSTRARAPGEVQTPVTGAPAADLRVGQRVYLRHAKAGELCERFNSLHLVSGGRIVDEVPTYRGEGRCYL